MRALLLLPAGAFALAGGLYLGLVEHAWAVGGLFILAAAMLLLLCRGAKRG